MTVKELISSGLIKDNDHIQISRPICGSVSDIRSGNWYNDQILDWMDIPIYFLKWNKDGGWYITLAREVIG